MLCKCALLCSFLVAALGFPQIVGAAPAAQAAAPSLSRTMLGLINSDRTAAGIAPLRPGRNLERVALAHSLDMANHDYFAHNTRSGMSPFGRIEAAGLRFKLAGENIGTDAGAGEVDMLRAIETLMLNSPEHRENLLRRTFTRIGIGIALIGSRLYITEDFKN